MRCETILETLLEADSDALREGRHEVAEHVADCPRCQRAVGRILEGERALERWLAAAPEPNLDAILEEADAAWAGGSAVHPGGSASGGRRARPPGRGPAWTTGAWITLAAAALAGLLLVENPAERGEGRTGAGTSNDAGIGGPATSTRLAVRPGARATPPTPEIEITGGRNAAVLHTDDPDITVIWFYGGDR